jgi:hypothetical protein
MTHGFAHGQCRIERDRRVYRHALALQPLREKLQLQGSRRAVFCDKGQLADVLWLFELRHLPAQ